MSDVLTRAEFRTKVNRRARLWDKARVENESYILGDADESSVFPADFIVPSEDNYPQQPRGVSIKLQSLSLHAPLDSIQTTPTTEKAETPFSEYSRVTDIYTYPASLQFEVTPWGETGQDDSRPERYSFALANDVHFVTAHPCVPSKTVSFVRSSSSPTIQQFDMDGGAGRAASVSGHPLHKYFAHTVIHLTDLVARQHESLESLMSNAANTVRRPSGNPAAPRALVVDCITNFAEPRKHRTLSTSTTSSGIEADGDGEAREPTSPDLSRGDAPALWKMHIESRRRQFGSDMEVMARAICAERGWNAVISRRRRGCLACAVREAGALGYGVVVRVD